MLAILGSAILVAVLVSIGSWHGQAESRGHDAEKYGPVVEPDSRLGSLESKFSDLVQRVELLEANRLALREPVMPEPAADVEQADASIVGLAERISRLEQLERTREQRGGRREEEWSARERGQATQDRIETAHRTIRDRRISDSDKAHAWLDLAQQDVYPWTDDIIAEMTSIGLSSENDRAREVVWIGAEAEFRSDLLVQPLISALNDPVANVREEAADALSQYLAMPGVQRALVWTSHHDESEEVRGEALKALREEE